jgi:hypothetical protein
MPDEKFDEKEREKQEEKTAEKSWDEKYRRDPLSAIVWAVIFIWAGLVLLADNLGYLRGLETRASDIPGLAAIDLGSWSIIFLGVGVIILIEVLVRLTVPDYRRPVGGSLFMAAIFFGIGLGGIFGWNVTWPLILIALGLIVILRGFWRGK